MKKIGDYYKIDTYFEPRQVRHYARYTSAEFPDISFDFAIRSSDAVIDINDELGLVFMDIVNKTLAAREQIQQRQQAALTSSSIDEATEISNSLKD